MIKDYLNDRIETIFDLEKFKSKMTEKRSRRSFLRSTALAGIAAGLPAGLQALEIKPEEQYLEPKGLTVLFQGDSITDGKHGRDTDPNHIMGHGYAFSIASRWGADFPSADLIFYNKGISGNRVSQLEARWETDCLNFKPDLLSILVGINDVAKMLSEPVTKPEDFQAFEDTYRKIISQSIAQNPNLILVLCLPFIAAVGKVQKRLNDYETLVEKLSSIIRKLAIEFNAILVDFQLAFKNAPKSVPPAYWIWDGIHPTVAGHELMTRVWLKQVSKKLKYLKKYA